MRRALLSLVILVAACAPSLPRPASVPPTPVASVVRGAPLVVTATAHDVFDALCKKMEATKAVSFEPPPRVDNASVDAPPPSVVRAQIVSALPARLRKTVDLAIARALPVKGGRLVEVDVADPEVSSPRGVSAFVVFLPPVGAPRLIEDATLVEVADFDGDGVEEPMTAACKDDALFGRDCTFTAWFSANNAAWSGHVHGDRTYVVGWVEGRRSIDLVPADANDGELALPSDVVRVLFSPRGATTTDGRAVFARDEATARRAYALEICTAPASLDATSRRAHLAALGASAAEIEAIVTGADSPLPPIVASPEPTATTDTFVDPSAAVWRALPKPSAAPCKAPLAPVEDLRAELVARAVESARARFVDLDGPVTVRVGCTSHGETPVVVARSERHDEASVSHRELYVVTKDRTVKIAGTRSRWRGEWHHVRSVSLGPAGDFDGDGERETLVVGDDLEGGATDSHGVSALVRGGKIVPVAGDVSAIVPLGPSRDGVMSAFSKAEGGQAFPWPPRLVELRGGTFVRVPVPARFTEATRAARSVFPKG